jgi:hypothetical protein
MATGVLLVAQGGSLGPPPMRTLGGKPPPKGRLFPATNYVGIASVEQADETSVPARVVDAAGRADHVQ